MSNKKKYISSSFYTLMIKHFNIDEVTLQTRFTELEKQIEKLKIDEIDSFIEDILNLRKNDHIMTTLLLIYLSNFKSVDYDIKTDHHSLYSEFITNNQISINIFDDIKFDFFTQYGRRHRQEYSIIINQIEQWINANCDLSSFSSTSCSIINSMPGLINLYEEEKIKQQESEIKRLQEQEAELARQQQEAELARQQEAAQLKAEQEAQTQRPAELVRQQQEAELVRQQQEAELARKAAEAQRQQAAAQLKADQDKTIKKKQDIIEDDEFPTISQSLNRQNTKKDTKSLTTLKKVGIGTLVGGGVTTAAAMIAHSTSQADKKTTDNDDSTPKSKGKKTKKTKKRVELDLQIV